MYQEIRVSKLDGSSNNANVYYEASTQPRETLSYVQTQSQIQSQIQSQGQMQTQMQSQTFVDYDFKAKGKYTGQVFSQYQSRLSKRGSIMPNTEFNFDKMDANYCQEHGEIKDYIIMSTPPQGFRIYDLICKNCLSHINYRNPNPVKAELFDTVIIDNKEKILQIKQNKLDLQTGNSGELIKILKDTILPLADELIFLSEDFDTQISGKISGNSAKAEEIAKLKNFINSIEFTSTGDPNVFGIGKNEPLKNKYIKLALFLVNFTGISNDNNHQGMVESLKSHMVKMVQIRKVMIYKITAWLRYLAGSFYEYVHGLENLSIDELFRQNLQIDYVSEEQLLQLKLFYEGELKKRDDRIRILEDENLRYRKEIDTLRASLAYMSEQETIIAELRMKLQKYESENAYQKQTISTLTNENQRLNGLNSEYLNQIEIFRTEITQLKIEFENKLRGTLEAMKIEYDKKIGEYILNLNQWTAKYSDLESKYNMEVRKYTTDIDSLQGQIRLINQRYENDVKALNDKYDSLFNEYNNIKITANNYYIQINQLTNDKQGLEKTIEKHVFRIRTLEDDLVKANNSIQILIKERDEARNQIVILKSDIDKLRGEINVLTNIKITNEGRINELQKKCDDLSALYVKLQNEFNLKLTIIANLEKRLRELDDVVCSSEGAIESYLEQIRKLEEKLDAFVKENNDLKVKLLIINERDAEITRLKLALTTCRDEWNKLSEAYDGLLVDIKTQISINEGLRIFIFELQSKIETHNQQVGGLDAAIRQQLEILTRQTLSKKSIEYNQNNDAVRKSQNEIDTLRVKLGRMETAKLTKSAVFSNVNISLSNDYNTSIDTTKTTNVITNNTTRYFDNAVYQNNSNNNANSSVNNYYNSNNNLISSNSANLNTGGNNSLAGYRNTTAINYDQNLISNNNANLNAGGNASTGGYGNTTALNYDQNLISNNNANLNAGGNASEGGYRNTTAISYDQSYLNNPQYTFKTTYDKSYGANVFNNAYATNNATLNASNVSYKTINDLESNANANANYVAVGCTMYGEEKKQVALNENLDESSESQ